MLKPFAVKWGQWTQYDHGQLTAWVTSETGVPKDYVVRGFDAADVPAGVIVPRGAARVYAVAAAEDPVGGRHGLRPLHAERRRRRPLRDAVDVVRVRAGPARAPRVAAGISRRRRT